MKKLIGREAEITELDSCMASDQSEFVIVYGRRRVGKTFLVDQYFKKTYTFSFVGGHKLTKSQQLRSFAKALKRYAHLASRPKFEDWMDAFDALEEYIESLTGDGKKVIFFDEMPWIDTPSSAFVGALENFWNGWAARRDDIVFVASGSATSWMVDRLVENQGGLHGRITNNIYLRPFNLHETEVYLRSRGCKWDRYQILQTYMVLGGVPYYLSLLNVNDSLVGNIDKLFFARNGALRMEFDELYNALFTNADNYISVVKLLSSHREGLIRDEILKATKIEGGTLSKILRNLERCDFIIKYNQFGNSKKGSIYRIIDFYTLFFYKFIADDSSQDEQWWQHNFMTDATQSWQGLSFELICLTHLPQIKNALQIGGISTQASSWRVAADKEKETEGAQIDLVISRADRMIHLCEMKFSVKPYTITAAYEEKIRNRMAIFARNTGTTHSLLVTFVTVFGVADGKHSGLLHSEVVADDLFLPIR